MFDKNDRLVKMLSKHEHAVIFRFPSHFIHERFNKIRAKDQQVQELREFFRQEVFMPAARFCYRASQVEYIGDGNAPREFWKKSKRMCMHACSKLGAYLDDGWVSVHFDMVANGLLEERELRTLLDMIDNMIAQELFEFDEQEKRRLQFHPDSKPDNYAAWRAGVYRDLQRAILNATFFETTGEGTYSIQSKMI
jgi:hypothetical protein